MVDNWAYVLSECILVCPALSSALAAYSLARLSYCSDNSLMVMLPTPGAAHPCQVWYHARMTRVTLPNPRELRNRLSGVGKLLTANKWERAAIVYAFTDIGGPHNSGREKPEPPKLNIRDFAALGFSGLTTNKSVSRYRDAWTTAISNGWAVPCEPGSTVTLPDKEFPVWPYGLAPISGTGSVTVTQTDEMTERRWERDDSYLETDRITRPRRPLEERILAHLEQSAKALDKLDDEFLFSLDNDKRVQLMEQLNSVQRLARDLAKRLRRRHLSSV